MILVGLLFFPALISGSTMITRRVGPFRYPIELHFQSFRNDIQLANLAKIANLLQISLKEAKIQSNLVIPGPLYAQHKALHMHAIYLLVGYRENVALYPRVKDEFGGLCVFYDSGAKKENKGIAPDHLIPPIHFGELVIGNTAPYAKFKMTLGDRNWRHVVRARFPHNPDTQIARIGECQMHHPYYLPSLKSALSQKSRRSPYHNPTALIADTLVLLATIG